MGVEITAIIKKSTDYYFNIYSYRVTPEPPDLNSIGELVV